MRKLLRCLLAAAAISPATGCAAQDDAIASFEYDLRGHRTLRAYAPEPAAKLRDGEKVVRNTYGVGDTRSPKTPYICTWRDIGANGMPGPAGQRPTMIFVACLFGTSAWTPPAKIVDAATEHYKREEAELRMTWELRGDSYHVSRFELEIRDLPKGVTFRSANFGDAEVAEIGLKQGRVTFPANRKDPFPFHVTAKVPSRYNRGLQAKEPTASVTISGTAVPMPNWVMY